MYTSDIILKCTQYFKMNVFLDKLNTTHKHPFVTLKRLIKDADPLEMQVLSSNPAITEEILLMYSIKNKWNMKTLSSNPSITEEFVLKYPQGFPCENKFNNCCDDSFGWYMPYLSANPSISMKFIINNPNGIDGVGWSLYGLSQNPNLSTNFIETNPGLWYGCDLQNNCSIPLDFILSHSQIKWNLNKHPGVTCDYILNNPLGAPYAQISTRERRTFHEWKFEQVCLNPNITFDFIVEKIYYLILEDTWKYISRISMKNLSSNKNLPIELLEKYPYGFSKDIFKNGYTVGNLPGWSVYLLSSNPVITEEFLQKHPEGVGHSLWNMFNLSMNPSISLEYMFNTPSMGWELGSMCRNPNITPKFYLSVEYTNNMYLGVEGIYYNPFTKLIKERNILIEKLRVEAARVIWYKGWLPYYYNPKRVNKGFDKDYKEYLSLY